MENFQQTAEQRNVQRLRSLGNQIVALGTEPTDDLVRYRHLAEVKVDYAMHDIQAIDEELERRTPVELCGD